MYPLSISHNFHSTIEIIIMQWPLFRSDSDVMITESRIIRFLFVWKFPINKLFNLYKSTEFANHFAKRYSTRST